MTGMEFVFVPGGCFQMGMTEEEKTKLIKSEGQADFDKYFADVLPSHEVCVDGLQMGETRGKSWPVEDLHQGQRLSD